MRFRDRAQAGRLLAEALSAYADRDDEVVLALPRGGVPVASEIASALHAPLDVLIVRKLGVPGEEELAMGAIGSGGVRFMNTDVVESLNIAPNAILRVADREQRELERRERYYRDDRPLPTIEGRTVILVDDGIATGASMWAAVMVVRQQRPAQIVVAVPVASPHVCDEFARVVDDMACILTPEPMGAVGMWYQDFSQTTDAEVRDLLQQAFAASEQDRAG